MLKVSSPNTLINENVYDNIVYNSKILGITASEVYGWSYPNVGNPTIKLYTSIKELNLFRTPIKTYIYLKDYNLDIGFTKEGMPKPERVICDFIKYPIELSANSYLAEALEGYKEDYGSFSKIESMLEELNIDKKLLSKYINNMYKGSNIEAME